MDWGLEYYREIECPCCGGEGSWDVYTGGYSTIDGSLCGYVEECSYCNGAGRVWEQTEPATLEDLEIQDANQEVL